MVNAWSHYPIISMEGGVELQAYLTVDRSCLALYA